MAWVLKVSGCTTAVVIVLFGSLAAAVERIAGVMVIKTSTKVKGERLIAWKFWAYGFRFGSIEWVETENMVSFWHPKYYMTL